MKFVVNEMSFFGRLGLRVAFCVRMGAVRKLCAVLNKLFGFFLRNHFKSKFKGFYGRFLPIFEQFSCQQDFLNVSWCPKGSFRQCKSSIHSRAPINLFTASSFPIKTLKVLFSLLFLIKAVIYLHLAFQNTSKALQINNL